MYTRRPREGAGPVLVGASNAWASYECPDESWNRLPSSLGRFHGFGIPDVQHT
jgi:hypothetical protein